MSKITKNVSFNRADSTLSTQGDDTLSTQGDGALSTQGDAPDKDGKATGIHQEGDSKKVLLEELPDILKDKISSIKKRENNPVIIKGVIKELCALRAYTSNELANLLNKREDYIRRQFINPLIKNKTLKHLHPEMLKHPDQAYLINKK